MATSTAHHEERPCDCGHYAGSHRDGVGVCTSLCGCLEFRPQDHADDPDLPYIEHAPADVDLVNHPPHYTAHPSGVECIQITEHMGFNVGNAVKYLWRADEKGAAIEDLKKAAWYVQRELQRRGAA